ncbi:hypothetical protein D3C72_862120 [compost metagenome]
MIGQQFAIGYQRLNGVVEAFQLRHVTHICRFVAQLTINLRQRSGTESVMAFTEINQQQGVISRSQLWRDGVTHIFHAGKSGDDQRQRRGHFALLVALLPAGFHRHRIFADRNGKTQRRTEFFTDRFYGFIQTRVFARVPGCGHPVCGEFDAFDIANLSRSDVGQRFADRQTGRGGEVQQCNRGTFAQRHRFAVVAVEARRGHRAVRHRDLPWANHLIAGHHTGHRAVADGHEEGFFRYRREVQDAIHGIRNGDPAHIQRFACGFTGLHVAGHLRRFAQQHVKRQINRLIVEVRIVHGQMQLFRRFTNDRVRCALAAAQFVEQRQLVRRDRQHVTFLGFITPDFQRAHAWLIAQNIAQVETPPAAAVAHQLRHGVRETARADVVNEQNRVSIAKLPAAVDHLLATTLHFRVVALYGSKIEVCVRLTRGH